MIVSPYSANPAFRSIPKTPRYTPATAVTLRKASPGNTAPRFEGWLWSREKKDPTFDETLNKTFKVLFYHRLREKVKPWLWITKPTPDEEAKALSAKLMKKIFDPYLADPKKGKALITSWEEEMKKTQPPTMLRDAGLFSLKHIKKSLDKPENLTKAVNLTAQILTHGGFDKVSTIQNVLSQETFKKATPAKQGQFLLEALGPVYLKAFQTLSTMPDLFEPHIQESMKQLYEDVSPIPVEQIKDIVQKELGHPIEKAFDSFDYKPLKVGTIAQVHKAVLYGEPVVVKIVKPGIRKGINEDMKILSPLIDLAQDALPHVDIKELYQDFASKIENECNMSRRLPGEPLGEAERLKMMQKAYAGAKNIVVPEVFDSHTTKNMLTMSFVKGKSLLNFVGNADVAHGYLSLIMDQIFNYGLFQADPHPGNIFYDEATQKYGCIDAGLVYSVTKDEQINFAKLLVALYSQSPDLIRDAILEKDMDKHPDYKAFQEKLATIVPPQDNLDYKATLKFMSEAEKAAKQLGLKTREHNPLLWKSLFTAVNVAKTLDPSVSIGSPAIMKLAMLFLKSRDVGYIKDVATEVIGTKVTKVKSKLRNLYDSIFGKKPE